MSTESEKVVGNVGTHKQNLTISSFSSDKKHASSKQSKKNELSDKLKIC